MERAQKQLLVVSLALLVTGVAFGLFISWDTGHRPRLVAREDYTQMFMAGDEPHSSVAPAAGQLIAANMRTARAVDFHAHSINMGIVLLLCAVLLPLLREDRRIDRIAAGLLAVAGVVYPVGLLLQFAQLRLAGEIAAAGGAGIAIVAFCLLCVRLNSALAAADQGSA